MPTFNVRTATSADQRTVWDYVSDIDRWAILFPGYQRHLNVSEREFEWHIRGDAGVWSRLVKFHVAVERWNPPESADFSITGMTEPVTGIGRFTIQPNGTGAIMTFDISAEADGPTAPMVNVLLTKFLSEHSGAFLERLKEEIETPPAASAPISRVSDKHSDPGVVILTITTRRTAKADHWLSDLVARGTLGHMKTRRVTRFEAIPNSADRGLLETVLHVVTSDFADTVSNLEALIQQAPEGLIESLSWMHVRELGSLRRRSPSFLVRRLTRGGRR